MKQEEQSEDECGSDSDSVVSESERDFLVVPRLQPICFKDEITLGDLQEIVNSFDESIERTEFQT